MRACVIASVIAGQRFRHGDPPTPPTLKNVQNSSRTAGPDDQQTTRPLKPLRNRVKPLRNRVKPVVTGGGSHGCGLRADPLRHPARLLIIIQPFSCHFHVILLTDFGYLYWILSGWFRILLTFLGHIGVILVSFSCHFYVILMTLIFNNIQYDMAIFNDFSDIFMSFSCHFHDIFMSFF